MNFTPTEAQKLEKFLQVKFSNPSISLKIRPQAADSVELLLNGECMGAVYKDDEEGEISYSVNISVLSIDLDEAA